VGKQAEERMHAALLGVSVRALTALVQGRVDKRFPAAGACALAQAKLAAGVAADASCEDHFRKADIYWSSFDAEEITTALAMSSRPRLL
jgi:hypothetical protein